MSITEFSDLLLQTITIEPWTGQDAYGQATYGTAVSYSARVVGKQRLIRNADGQDKVSQTTIYLLSNAEVDSRSRITLPSDFLPNSPPIMAVGRFPDESGSVHHTTIYV